MPESSNTDPSKTENPSPEGSKPKGKRISGRLAILSVYGLALAMAAVVFWFGKREKREWDHISVPGLSGHLETIRDPDSLQALVSTWPATFTQVSRTSGPNGDRFAVVVPCFNETPSLTFEAGAKLICPFCEMQDTLSLRAVLKPRVAPLASQTQTDTAPALYRLQFGASVKSDSAQKNLQDSSEDSSEVLRRREWSELLFAPSGRIIMNSPTQTLTGPALGLVRNGETKDTTWFLPQTATTLLETVRAEEESPEGCTPD